ncbi:hypothetical protein BDV38DRAFT_258071 [Aspergillus pseudotamarii]|uniref:Uncharacterized protein n=1 Tax=Aspergillus pseudotamarii TaxID=132259 RepID=A0A5N6SK06_ASPPS|nr:uncharacterized protein BDV38DRAFT_258071 [Aspergillus pseudotamarii]KAE8133444.1 hypothetical protein BDV38DRAFT_258071 [Aspergillus pseudotamarii]
MTSRMKCPIIITSHGSIGLAARKGFQIVYLPSGGRYPFTVRSRDDGAVNLVGNCYVQGVITLLSTNIYIHGTLALHIELPYATLS